MILRILGEGQYDVPEPQVAHLNDLDDALVRAVEAGDDDQFGTALADLLAAVRKVGVRVPAASLSSSDLVLPDEEAGLSQVRDLLADDGLIPG